MIAIVATVLAATASPTHAWSHQQHILITRMAALRIINDPDAPEGLKNFLKTNMKYDLEACRKLTLEETVGIEAKNYLTGLDGACTLPDRIRATDANIAPYNAPESKMHFMDWENFVSDRPQITAVPHDLHDPRWKQAGYIPFRVEEMYNELVKAFATGGGEKFDNAHALKITGYLSHYIADCHQPLHATADYKSYSYLFGKIPAIRKITQTLPDGREITKYTVDKEFSQSINPHTDLEFQLFEDTQAPRKELREKFWKELERQIALQTATTVSPYFTKAGSFTRALEILADSYAYLPAIGKAAQAAYATGKFDPKAFFSNDIIQLMAARHAAAILELERTLRTAWSEAKSTKLTN